MAHVQTEPEFPEATFKGGQGMPAMPGCATGVGGNSTLANQNEREVSEQSWEEINCSYEGYQDDFSTVQGVYRMPNT